MKPDKTVNIEREETVSQIFFCSPVSKILVVYALFSTGFQKNNFTLFLLVIREPLSSMHCTRGGDKSLAKPTSRCRRTESIV